jgi:L-alanine-DL-glutamate epimerase-like enolase superfamily enzyme
MVHFHVAKQWSLPLEYVDWWDHLFCEGPLPRDGLLRVPTAPGLGFKFDHAAIAAHCVERLELD